MTASFYIFSAILGVLACYNFFRAGHQSEYKYRILGWVMNGLGFVLCLIAVIISLFTK